MKKEFQKTYNQTIGPYLIPIALLAIAILFAVLGQAFSNIVFLSSLLYALGIFFILFDIILLLFLLFTYAFSKK